MLHRKSLLRLGALAALPLAFAGCGSSENLDGGEDSKASGKLVVGSSNFSENVVLAYIFAYALEDAGYDTQVKPNIGSREVLMPALLDGSVDVVPEYAGSLLAYLDADAELYESDEIYAHLQEVAPEGLVVLEPAAAENKDVKVVTAEYAAEHNLVAIPDLEPIASEVVFGGPPESTERRAGLKGIEDVYGMSFGEFKPIDGGGPLTVAGLLGGDIHVAQMYSTQPAIAENGFVVLEDPLNISTAENVIPLVRESVLTPELTAALTRVTSALTTEDLIELNTRVETDKEDPQKVAREFVDSL